MGQYPIPAQETRTEIQVLNSRFIATVGAAFDVQQARAFIARIRGEFADAAHNVPAFLIGHGATEIAHCHDDGEPPGTAGRPALAILRGSGLGDVVVVVTRYFGGTKLGMGGLVRAYGAAVQATLAATPLAVRVPTHTVLVASPYALYDRIRHLAEACQGQVVEESFAAAVTITARLPVEQYPVFHSALREMSNGTVEPLTIDTQDAIIPLARNSSK